ncbi:MAG: MarR family winged helix-turn-helix transcriptional regulator [Corynebacterium sp.]|uniref:MarR family winged helix-turn-helix transcriptional regulator n=1 Tax=Corynebacterium sp. TaxID=1720 RepID=UPI003F950585
MTSRSESVDQVGVLVKQTQSLLHQAMDRELRPLGLTVPQFACLRALGEEPGMSGAELARRMFVSRQSTSGVVGGLEGRALIERAAERGPQRQRATVLTGAGREILGRAEDAVAGVVGDMTRSVADGDLEVTRGVLSAMAENLVTETRGG